MKTLKYTIIKNQQQYNDYCDCLESLVCAEEPKPGYNDEIELLELLIEKWDSENNSFKDLDPVQLLKSLMLQNKMKSKDLISLLGLSKGTISKILNYHKGLSKESIRKLAAHFKLSQEAFNRPYPLITIYSKQSENKKSDI